MKPNLIVPILFAFSAAAALAEPLHTDTDVLVSGQGGYHSYRIPAIEAAPDGTLIAFSEARKYTGEDPGYGDQEIDLVSSRSTDNGATWSPMVVIEHSGHFWSSANPCTVLDRSTGKVWVFYVRAKPHRSSDTARPMTHDMENRARWSADNGKTWSDSINLTAAARDMKDPAWKVSVPGPGGAIQTKSGRLIVAMWKMPFSDFVIYSDDHGASWHRGAVVPGGQGGDECQAVELASGRVMIDMRQEKGPTRWDAESTDGGETWTDLRPGVTVEPVCCAIEKFTSRAAGDDKDRLIWTGPHGPKRRNLIIRTSYDDGKTFVNERPISHGYAAYSDLTILKDGTIGVLWERGVKKGYEFITFTRLNKEWLEGSGP